MENTNRRRSGSSRESTSRSPNKGRRRARERARRTSLCGGELSQSRAAAAAAMKSPETKKWCADSRASLSPAQRDCACV